MSDSTPIKDTDKIKDNNESNAGKRPLGKRILKGVLWTVASIVALVVLVAVGATLWLTPQRVADIASREASAYMKADLKVAPVDWTLWSSFPWLTVQTDSLSLRSRSLDSVPASLRPLVPAGADRLLRTGRIHAGINILKAIKGDISLRGIEVAKPEVNLVAMNDSVANYLIIPPSKKKMEIPQISLDTIAIGEPMKIAYRNIAQDIDVNAVIDDFRLNAAIGKESLFHILASAAVSARSGEFSTGTAIPLRIDGNVGIADNNRDINIRDMKVALADITATLSGDLKTGDKPELYPFSVAVDAPDVMQLLPFLPAGMLPKEMEGIKGYIPLRLKADLLAPLPLSATTSIPAMTASVASDGGKLSFQATPSQTVALEGLGLDADLLLNPSAPDESRLRISDLRMETDGTSLHVSGAASRILSGNPDVNLDLQCAADLAKATKKILPGSTLAVTGDLAGNTSLSCQLADLSKKQLKNLKLDGSFQIAALALNDAASRLSARLSDFSLKIAADVPEIAPSSLSDGKVNLLTSIGHSDIRVPSSALTASLDNTSLHGEFGAKGSMQSPVASGSLGFHAGSLKATQGKNSFSSEGVDVDLDGRLRQIPFSPNVYYPTNPTSPADSAVAANVRHTPLYLSPSISPMVQSVLSLLDLKAKVAAKEGMVLTEAFPADNRFSDLRLTTNLDTLLLSSVRFRTRGASGFLSARTEGLRAFLASSSPVPLKVDMTADLDEVDINKLSGTYFRGQQLLTGRMPQLIPPAPGAYTAADSLCVALPRNLSVNARLSSRSATYMDYSFSPLSTRITLDNGDAALRNLSVGTPFCSDDITWTYSTSNLDSISMAIKADVADFDFVKFRSAYPSLVEAEPQLANLSANADLKVDGNFLLDPDMFLNAESMEGDVNLKVNGFSFIRDKKMRHITHLMMIRGDGPISIDSLDIHAAFHDNLLQLDPFTIDGGGYKLLIGGVNNLQGQMYYHIGLLNNPLHLPFGVNLVNTFRHPEIRFGGRWIKDGRERKIAAELGSDVNVNIMRQLSHGWLLFVGNAAKYDFKNNSFQPYDVR